MVDDMGEMDYEREFQISRLNFKNAMDHIDRIGRITENANRWFQEQWILIRIEFRVPQFPNEHSL